MLYLWRERKHYRCKTTIEEQHLAINKLEVQLSGQRNISTLSGHHEETIFQNYVATEVHILVSLWTALMIVRKLWNVIYPDGNEIFPPVQTGPGVHPASYKMGTGSFPGVKCGRSVLLTTHPLLVPRSWKSRAIPLPTLWATPGL